MRKTVSKHRRPITFVSKFDTMGAYTGVTVFDKGEEPVQDADDL